MSNNDHTARRKSWDEQKSWAVDDSDSDCILELRARVERLEQAQQQPAPGTPAGQGELLQQLTWDIADFVRKPHLGLDCTPVASEFLGKVADWLEMQEWLTAADLLRREVGR